MPFVACQSNGGPYEDDSFTAGYECGRLDTLFQFQIPRRYQCYIKTANVLQIDLIAMKYGYLMASEATEMDEWTIANFIRVHP